MKQLVIVFTLLLSFVGFGQDLETIKIVEKVKGFKKTKKEYYVLKDNAKVKHGEYKEYYKKHLVVDGAYKMGEKDGQWVYKSPTENYLQKGSFVKGKEVGDWERHLGGKKIFEGTYGSNNILSSYKTYNKEGEVVEEFNYDKTNGLGKGERVLESGFSMKYETDSLNRFNGLINVYYPSGELFQKRKYKRGKLYWMSGVLTRSGEVQRKVKFSSGKGVYLNYFPEPLKKGVFKVESAITYKDSVPFGMFLKYNLKGKPIQSGMKYKGEKLGVWKFWSAKEKKYIEKTFKINKKKSSLAYWEILSKKLKEKNDVPFAAIGKGRPASPMSDFSEMKSAKLKKAFSNSINEYVSYYFDSKSILDSPQFKKSNDGVSRAAAIFKINTLGEVCDIKVRAKNKITEKHLKEVLEGLPAFIPAYYKGRVVNLIFSLPIVFRYDQQKK